VRKALLTVGAIIALSGAARADDICVGEAYHGRHEQCVRQVWVTQFSADFVRRHRYAIEDVIRDAVSEDWYDARLDWMRAHPNPAEIGMSAEEVRSDTEWGPPWHINSTQTASGSREQWVYQWPGGGFMGFLYFENDRLAAIQREGARRQ
jgi:hypothetical protein